MNLNATILGQTISFVLFVWFCMKYIWSPILFIIEKRQKKIADSLESIKNSTIQSENAHNEALTHLKQAKVKAQEILKNAQKCKIKILYEAQDEANKEREKILSKAQEYINQEKKRVANELRKKIGQLVIESTEKIINRSINEIIDYDFINTIIKTIPYEE